MENCYQASNQESIRGKITCLVTYGKRLNDAAESDISEYFVRQVIYMVSCYFFKKILTLHLVQDV